MLNNVLIQKLGALDEIHTLWHTKILAAKGLEPGWGKSFDKQSDALLGKVGHILLGMCLLDFNVLQFVIH